MRKIISLFLSSILVVGCSNIQIYQLDQNATSKAKWKIGEITFSERNAFNDKKIERKFLGITKTGYYVLQSFYEGSDQKYTDPFFVTNIIDLNKPTLNSLKGKYSLYALNGQKVWEAHYKNQMIHGKFKRWYLNGQLHVSGQYINGFKTGVWTEYYQNGKRKSKGEYCWRGGRVGTWHFWDEQGALKIRNFESLKSCLKNIPFILFSE